MLPTRQACSSFLVRFYRGPNRTMPDGAWQITIAHIQSGDQHAVTNVAAIAQFLIDHAGPNPILLPSDQTLR